ncbi:HDOD domain-containing protein [bacterium]|nr:HDOD domain-containing protein [bacterium]
MEADIAREQMNKERDRLAEMGIVRVLSETHELPALPSIATRVMQITSDPKATLVELRAIIETDESLASKILRFANSALYGRVGMVTTLTSAINLLGFLTIRWLVVTTSAHTLFRRGGKPDNDHIRLWEHALKCAIGARLLAKQLSALRIEEAFICGLLHDVGKLVIMEKLPGYLTTFCKWGEALDIEFYEVEADVIGIDHCEVSGSVFENWHFPEVLAEPVANHHTPERAKQNGQLAHILCTIDKVFPLRDCTGDAPPADELAALPFMLEHSITESEIAKLLADADDVYGEMADLLRL